MGGTQKKLLRYLLTLALMPFLGVQPLYAAEEPISITVMTLNLHNGKDSIGESNIDRFLELVATRQPDIISLQEVERRHLKSLKSAGYHIIPGMNANLPFFRFGNVVLTKHKVIYHRHHYLPSKREQRGLNEVAVEINGSYFRILNTHIGLGWEEQLRQINEIVRITDYLSGPILITGDFNLEPTSKLFNFFRLHHVGMDFPLLKTFPTHNPRYLIDLIWYSEHWRPVETEVINWDGSDHFPVISRLILSQPCYSPLAQIEIPDLTRKYNPLLPDIGVTGYHLYLTGTNNGVSKEIKGGGSINHQYISLGIESKDDQPIYSVAFEKDIDLRDYFSLWGVRGKAQWSLEASAASEQDPWLSFEQYYRWSDNWGTKIAANNGSEPEFTMEQMYLPNDKLRYRLAVDNDHGYSAGIAITPDHRQVFEVQRTRENEEYYWSLSWGLYGFIR